MLFISLSFVLASVVGHIGYVGLALDRSMRREIDTATALARDEVSRRLSGKIAHLDRQRSLGTMAASLGHELNQPLTAILISAQVARRGLLSERFSSGQMIEFFEKIVSSTQRASQIIERIRGFIRPTAELREPVDLAKAVAQVRALVADEAKTRSVTFSVATMAAPILVLGDPVQLSQVILNVVRNALDALADASRREIQVSLQRLQDRAVLRIRDTGPGLRPELLAQIGTPFFTTKSTGLGMGLSIARSIVEQFSGTLVIRNADGGGTLVELNFPALAARRTDEQQERP
jgi:C4-dicarboxylate-specific signal transduction histidine kinase